MSNWLPDLSAHAGPRYRAIVEALAADLRAGRITPGTRLPPQRALAWQLKVTVGTVARAYAEAERLGLVSGEVGRGTFVRDPAGGSTQADYFAWSWKGVDGGGLINMATNLPSGERGAAAIAAALRGLAERTDLAALLGYHIETAPPRQRAAGAAWLAEAGVIAPPERVIVTAGGQQALLAAIAALTRPGDAVLVEEFCYPGIKTATGLLGRELVPVAADALGMLPDAVERAAVASGARVLYANPTVQNPSAATLPAERREALAALVRRHDIAIIEDGIGAFLLPGAPPPLAALAPERTVHLTSLSKSVAPGLRVGFMAAPEGFVGRLGRGITGTTMMAPPLMAELAAQLIEDGSARAAAEGQRLEATARTSTARAMLGAACCPAEASLNLWLRLPEPWAGDDFAADARANGVLVTSGSAFAVGRPRYEAVRVSISAPNDREEMMRGLRILGGMLRVSPDNCCMTV